MEYEIESFISKDLSKITNHVEVGRQIAQRAVNNFATTQGKQGSYGCLVAFELSAEPYLCEYAITDMQPEFKYPDQIWYVSMGSGQTITDPFLGVLKKLFWKGDKLPSVKEAMLFVVWTLQAAVDLNAGGVNGPIDLAVLEKKDGQFRARLLGEGEMQEHLANLKAIEEKISEVRNIDPGQSAPTIPQPPET